MHVICSGQVLLIQSCYGSSCYYISTVVITLPALSITAGYEEGRFDVILSGIVTPVCLSHDHDLLVEYARILKPSGLLIIREPIVEQGMLQDEEGNLLLIVLLE